MKPLQAMAMGYLIIALYARQSGYDLLPDPVGWVLVLVGVRGLPDAAPRRLLGSTAAVALVVSLPLWVPALRDGLADEDASLAWAADLPGFVFAGLLFFHLAQAALRAGDRTPAAVLRSFLVLVVVVATLPILVFGVGWDDLGPTASGLGQLLQLGTVVTLFALSGRVWAGGPPTPTMGDSAAGTTNTS